MATSNNKDRYYSTVGNKSRRASPADAQNNHGFFQTGQGGRTVLPPITDSFPTSRFSVPVNYPNSYTQPRSAQNMTAQTMYNPYQTAGASPQFPTSYPNYEMHEQRFSTTSYPTYPSRPTTPANMNQIDSRRLPPLSTTTPPMDRWQQPSFVAQAAAFPGNSIRSPIASYPQAHVAYSNATHQANPYQYHMSTHDHSSISPPHHGHGGMYEEAIRLDPRSTSPYSRGPGGSSHVSQPRSYSPPPVSPTSPEEPTIKKKRKRADAAQLKVLNETYNRTAFPSTEERIALAKALDMSARSVQIWFQNKRQSMRQTNRQSSHLASSSHHPFSVQGQMDPMVEDLVAHPAPQYDGGSADALYLTSHGQDTSRSHGHGHSQHHHSGYHHQSSSHRHIRDQEDDGRRQWPRPL
ncbi:hypothetical protein D9613_000391 [Agrocybe pediades]|uniref:Homeobox domain-containing protein n=1 Tax=Agrocybe pediades TaxID=84607 RepID=A0A8H4VS54_9AGAR|nr:hypothetical protein D9613_000391 [Agrocybe pediades]